jgi:hypothetical protein
LSTRADYNGIFPNFRLFVKQMGQPTRNQKYMTLDNVRAEMRNFIPRKLETTELYPDLNGFRGWMDKNADMKQWLAQNRAQLNFRRAWIITNLPISLGLFKFSCPVTTKLTARLKTNTGKHEKNLLSFILPHRGGFIACPMSDRRYNTEHAVEY